MSTIIIIIINEALMCSCKTLGALTTCQNSAKLDTSDQWRLHGGAEGGCSPPHFQQPRPENDTIADAVSKAKRSDLPYLLLST